MRSTPDLVMASDTVPDIPASICAMASSRGPAYRSAGGGAQRSSACAAAPSTRSSRHASALLIMSGRNSDALPRRRAARVFRWRTRSAREWQRKGPGLLRALRRRQRAHAVVLVDEAQALGRALHDHRQRAGILGRYELAAGVLRKAFRGHRHGGDSDRGIAADRHHIDRTERYRDARKRAEVLGRGGLDG